MLKIENVRTKWQVRLLCDWIQSVNDFLGFKESIVRFLYGQKEYKLLQNKHIWPENFCLLKHWKAKTKRKKEIKEKISPTGLLQ